MEQIKCENLAAGYENKKIIENLNFSVNEGDYLCILGENGTGKSTLMKTLLNLIPPLEGKIKTGNRLSRNDIGYVPQQTYLQRDFPASVEEIILSGCQGRLKWRAFYKKADKKRTEEAIEKMNIKNIRKKCYSTLSGGQQKRVLIARALCAAEKILVLDEPVSGLDPKVSEELYEIIYNLNKKDKMTIIMVSHDINAALKYADYILHIGTEIFFGDKKSYLKSRTGREFTQN